MYVVKAFERSNLIWVFEISLLLLKRKQLLSLSLPTSIQVRNTLWCDCNTPIDPTEDSSRPDRRQASSHEAHEAVLHNLESLRRGMFTIQMSRSSFTGPLPRANRLDYIFMSEELSCNLYGSSKYFAPQHGDHLAHEVTLAPPKQIQGRGNWRSPRYLFACGQVAESINCAATDLIPVIESADNPGLV